MLLRPDGCRGARHDLRTAPNLGVSRMAKAKKAAPKKAAKKSPKKAAKKAKK